MMQLNCYNYQSLAIYLMISRLLQRPLQRFCNNSLAMSVDLSRYINKSAGWEDDCTKVVQILYRGGFIYAHDPRADFSKNDIFLQQMERYFALRSRQFEQGTTNLDVCVDNIKVGLQQNYSQLRGDYAEEKQQLKEEHLAMTPMQPKVDPTWRYHWLLGSDRNIVPQEFNNFSFNMDSWGQQLFQTNITVCQMTAIALGLDKDAISKMFLHGSNYLSPPAVDLNKSKIGQVITGFHRDFGLITAHAPTKFEGMYAWLLTGEKVEMKIPDRHLLIQGGKQLQWLTGGYLKAGFHQVIHNRKVENQVKENLKAGKSNWRVACGMFSYVQGNLRLKPFPEFQKPGVDKIYPSIQADEYLVQQIQEDAKRKAKQV